MRQTPQKIRLLWLSSFASVLLLVFLLWRVPQWTVPTDITDSTERSELLNANRDNIWKGIQTLGSLGFVATAYLAWRNLQVAEQNFKVSEDKQVTDRFSKAVEMLADERLEVRLGGIYALERIAKDSVEDHPVVISVLTAFVRERSTTRIYREYLDAQTWIYRRPSEDLQSAMTVIGRRDIEKDQEVVNLKGAVLEKMDLREAHLNGANLSRANLKGAKLNKGYLENAILYNAYLQSSSLICAKLQGADLRGSHLERAYLGGANLEKARLNSAHFEEADFEEANLEESNLTGAFLNGARGITFEQLTKSRLCFTTLPEGIGLEANRDCSKVGIDPDQMREMQS